LKDLTMDVTSALFYVFSAVLLFAAFRVITARNPVHAALYLVLAFFQASGVWMLLKAEFLSISLVLVYVGAVMVLFLFVVMMLDINLDSIRQGFWKHFPLAATVGAVIALEIAAVMLSGFRITEPAPAAAFVTPVVISETVSVTESAGQVTAKVTETVAADVGHLVMTEASNTRELGILLYTQYLYPVQIAALILLVALIAAIALTLRSRKDSKSQNPGDQVRVRARDRVSLVKMDPVKPAVASAEENQA
jgi:NADH-quinone oxidoreductase subunit J